VIFSPKGLPSVRPQGRLTGSTTNEIRVTGQKPQTGQAEICLDQVLANLPLPRLVGGHRAVGQHEAGYSVGGQVMHDMLHPGEVGVPTGGAQYTQRLSSRSRSPSRSETLNGGLASMKSARRSGWRLLWKVSPWPGARWCGSTSDRRSRCRLPAEVLTQAAPCRRYP
jgi:hypothetical protein